MSNQIHELLVDLVSELPEEEQRGAVRHVITASIREMNYALATEYGVDQHIVIEETRAACKEIFENLYCSCHPRSESPG